MIISVLTKAILKEHRNIKLYRNPLILIYSKTNPQRQKEANKLNIQCGSTIVLSNEISMPPGVGSILSLVCVHFGDMKDTHSTEEGCFTGFKYEFDLARVCWAWLQSRYVK
jgi:hypothetical protein